jgi:ribonuclease BN (tRNA processing enzyme)
VAGLAAQAGVGRLVLVHLNPLAGEDSYLSMRDAARAVFARTEVMADGVVVGTAAV